MKHGYTMQEHVQEILEKTRNKESQNNESKSREKLFVLPIEDNKDIVSRACRREINKERCRMSNDPSFAFDFYGIDLCLCLGWKFNRRKGWAYKKDTNDSTNNNCLPNLLLLS